MTTLEAQRRRLLKELKIAESELQQLTDMPVVEPTMVNFYEDLLSRHREMIDSIERHLARSSCQRYPTGDSRGQLTPGDGSGSSQFF